MISSINISKDVLSAVALAQAVKDVRFYLNGVFFEAEAGRVIATDGHRLHAARAVFETADAGAFIAPSDLIKQALKAKAKTIRFEFDGKKITASAAGMTYQADAIEGRFPDYRRLFSSSSAFAAHHERVNLNPVYVLDAKKACALVGMFQHAMHAPDPIFNASSMGLIATENGSFAALIMGVRDHAIKKFSPTIAGQWAAMPNNAQQKSEAA